METKALILLLLVFGGATVQTLGETGVLSIDCGASLSHVDSRNVTWFSDRGFAATGINIKLNTTASSLDDPLDTLRVFTKSDKKSCYVLPTQTGCRYLVQTSYRYGNYDGQNSPPTFNLAIDVTTVAFINTSGESSVIYETIATARGEKISVCLFSDDSSQAPFISALEMRRIPESMYAVEEGQYLSKICRINFEAKLVESVRFPDLRDSAFKLFRGAQLKIISTSQEVNQSQKEGPPSYVLRTACSTTIMIPVTGVQLGYGEFFRAYSYFAEVVNLDDQVLRSFDIILNGVYVKRNMSEYPSEGLNRGVEIPAVTEDPDVINVTLAPRSYTNLGPIITAFEIYRIISASVPTFESDVYVVTSLVTSFKLEHLSVGDPCLPIPWEWLSCSMKNPRRVVVVKLSAMNLTGIVPLCILGLSELTELWLDHNHITGTIPDLSSLKKLKSLHLEDNEFNGSLPMTLGDLHDLGELILDDNRLSGKVPMNLLTKNNLKISLAGNPEMSLPDCVTGRSPCTQAENTGASSRSKGKPSLVVISVVSGIGATLLLIGTGAIAFFLSKKKKLKFPHPPRKSFYTISDIQAAAAREHAARNSIVSLYVGKARGRSQTDGEVELAAEAREFTSSEVKKATRDFSRKVGEGTFGSVFYGKLPGRVEIAVRIHGCHRTREFQDGVDILSRVRHQNLVSMIGYSKDTEESFLIYEFLPGGSLLNNLNDPEACKLLTWKLRLNIALQAANGLLHLHTDYNPPIIHRNMKSSNILLTKKLSAKVSDFGLSILAPEGETDYVSILVKGATSGYLDPEFYSKQRFTENSDVYSFGVVLLEIISGRGPVNLQLPRAEWNLSDWVRHQLELGNIEAVVDQSLDRAYSIASMWKVADIAMYSVEPEAKHRPTMSEVVKELEEAYILEAQGKKSAGSLYTSFSITDKAERSHLEPVYKKISNREY